MFIVDPWNYHLFILIHGIEDGFNFAVERQVGERLQGVLSAEDEDGSILPFFCFECNDSRRIALSVDAIDAVNYLFDPAIRLPLERTGAPDGDEDVHDLTLYFRNRAKPLQCVTEEREELDGLFEVLATDPFVVQRFLSFTDEDGEMMTFNARNLVLFIAKAHGWSEDTKASG